jgi:copper transport protein
MSPRRRALACALTVAGLSAATAGPAAAHATLAASAPAARGRVEVGPAAAVLVFSKRVEVLNRRDVTVVDGDGVRIDNGARSDPRNPRRIVVPLRGPMVADSYTVRYRVVSADSHEAVGAYVFAVGHARLAAPILAGAGGLSDSSPAAVAARAGEIAALMALVGLLAFRALVWAPAVESAAGLGAGERAAAVRGGQRVFWRAFWAFGVLAGIAETAVLAGRSAIVFHTGFVGALRHPADAYRLVGASRFGDLYGWRCGALAVLFALAFLAWNVESEASPAPVRRARMALMALPGVAALTLLAAQGHASQAPLAPLSVAFDAAHLTAASIWTAGLLCLATILVAAPRALPEGGRSLAAAALARFSRVALWSVVVIAATGVARATAELAAPEQLITTGYGRSLMLKASLLAPILVLARRNRRFVARLAGGAVPSVARLRAVARAVQAELAIAMGIVVVAAVLVAQIPGRG